MAGMDEIHKRKGKNSEKGSKYGPKRYIKLSYYGIV